MAAYTPAGLPAQGNTERKCERCGGTGRNGRAARAAELRAWVAGGSRGLPIRPRRAYLYRNGQQVGEVVALNVRHEQDIAPPWRSRAPRLTPVRVAAARMGDGTVEALEAGPAGGDWELVGLDGASYRNGAGGAIWAIL
jgi:hypothetical protein